MNGKRVDGNQWHAMNGNKVEEIVAIVGKSGASSFGDN
jgi:hypothetical protein